jgi:serine/threonine protein kinase
METNIPIYQPLESLFSFFNPYRLPFKLLYLINETIGQGGFGTVYAGTRICDKLNVAIKIVKRNKIKELTCINMYYIPKELELLQKAQSIKGVIKLIDFFNTKHTYIYVFERLPNTIDLFNFITLNGPLNEIIAQVLFRQIVKTVIDCYMHGIIHCDIKDENILVNVKTLKTYLIDFGAGKFLTDNTNFKFQGTRIYSPPEWISNKQYIFEPATVWSLGILLFNIVQGDIPFKSDNEICSAQLYFFNSVSNTVKHLIYSCLCVSPTDRIKLTEICNHPWLQ